MTTLYYLLMLKAAKNGYASSADVNNPGFMPELLNPANGRDASLEPRERLNQS